MFPARTLPLAHRALIEPPIAHNVPMAEFSYLVIYLPRETTRDAAKQILTDHASTGTGNWPGSG
jgi:hypothetical protein